jgi:hypothetical protein
MKIFLLVLGCALFILGIQDGLRLVADNQQSGIFTWLPGGVSLYIGLDVALATSGGFLAKYALQMKSKPSAR